MSISSKKILILLILEICNSLAGYCMARFVRKFRSLSRGGSMKATILSGIKECLISASKARVLRRAAHLLTDGNSSGLCDDYFVSLLPEDGRIGDYQVVKVHHIVTRTDVVQVQKGGLD